MTDHTDTIAVLDELLIWARTGRDNWRKSMNEILPNVAEHISSVHGVSGPSILSANARHQSFAAFVEQLERAKDELEGKS